MNKKSKTDLEIKRLFKAAAKYEKIISNSKPESRQKSEAIKSRSSCARKIWKLIKSMILEDKKLPFTISDNQLARIISVLKMATRVFEDPKSAFDWMNEPCFGLGWQKPIDLILKSEAGEQVVKDLLGRIEYGVIS